MSKDIKDLINSIKSGQVLQEPAPAEITKPIEATPELEKKIVVDVITPPAAVERKIAKKIEEPTKESKVKPTAQPVQTPVKSAPKAGNTLSDNFFVALSDTEFSFEQKSVSNIDDRIYEIFMLLKRKKRVKNIAVIINTILSNYIEDNKDAIKSILLNNQL